MYVYLVQHGAALDKSVDPGRPLSPDGTAAVTRVAEFLQQSRPAVFRIVHSGKMRAHQTAEILGEWLLPDAGVETINGIDPNDPVDTFAARLNQLTHDTMVVGHLPFMSRLTSLLLAGTADVPLLEFTPGSVVCLQHSDKDGWRMTWMLRPELLAG